MLAGCVEMGAGNTAAENTASDSDAPAATPLQGEPDWGAALNGLPTTPIGSSLHDVDQDRVDDRIADDEPGPDGLVGVAIQYSEAPSAHQFETLAAAGFVTTYASPSGTVHGRVAPSRAPVLLEAGGQYIESTPDARVSDNFRVKTVSAASSPERGRGAWLTYNLEGRGVVVAVLDTGVDNEHLCLADRVLADYDATTNTNADTPPSAGHGTAMACLITGQGGARFPTAQNEFVGVAPGARIVDVKVLSGQQCECAPFVERGLDWVLAHRDTAWDATHRGIQVVSMSFGSADGDPASAQALKVNRLVQAGIIVVAAVGNDGGQSIDNPAAADGAIAVGGAIGRSTVDPADDAWWFDDCDGDGISMGSNYGPRSGGGSTEKPDVVVPQDGLRVGFWDPERPERHDIIAASCSGGTSTATAIVAGIAALMKQANMAINGLQAKAYLRESSSRATLGWDAKLGMGVPNATQAGRSARDAWVSTASRSLSVFTLRDDVAPAGFAAALNSDLRWSAPGWGWSFYNPAGTPPPGQMEGSRWAWIGADDSMALATDARRFDSNESVEAFVARACMPMLEHKIPIGEVPILQTWLRANTTIVQITAINLAMGGDGQGLQGSLDAATSLAWRDAVARIADRTGGVDQCRGDPMTPPELATRKEAFTDSSGATMVLVTFEFATFHGWNQAFLDQYREEPGDCFIGIGQAPPGATWFWNQAQCLHPEQPEERVPSRLIYVPTGTVVWIDAST